MHYQPLGPLQTEVFIIFTQLTKTKKRACMNNQKTHFPNDQLVSTEFLDFSLCCGTDKKPKMSPSPKNTLDISP